jgi:hypothetical protein
MTVLVDRIRVHTDAKKQANNKTNTAKEHMPDTTSKCFTHAVSGSNNNYVFLIILTI